MSKRCTKCSKIKSLSEFTVDKHTNDGLCSYCRVCHRLKAKRWYRKNREKVLVLSREYYQANRERCKVSSKLKREKNKKQNKEQVIAASRAKHLQASYGLSVEQHKQMYINQNGCCALCNRPIEYDKVHTDHNHQTGEVRGLLCRRCNYGMGFIDDADFMQGATEYVK